MFQVKFADIGEGLTEGKVVEIFVKEGDSVKEGQELFSVETDKVNSDIYAQVSGVIKKINIKKDQDIKVGEVVMEIDDGNATSSKAKVEPIEENASVVGATPVSNDVIPSRQEQPSSPSPAPSPAMSNVKIDEEFDVIVVGAGIGGYICSIKCAQLGLKTLNIEKEYYGGVCLNVGCIPTKSLLRTSKAYSDVMDHSKVFGIDIPNLREIKINYKQAVKRKNEIVSKLTNGVKFLLDKNKVKKEFGVAKALDKNTITVNGKNYRCKKLVIATGSVPNQLPIKGFEEARKSGIMIDSTKILDLTTVPKKLTVIGGGVIGVEFGCLFASLGTKVTVVEAAPKVLGILDKDVQDVIKKEMVDLYKIKIYENVKIEKFENKKLIFTTSDGKKESVAGDYCLESVGRKVSIDGFENIGLALDQKKAVIIDDNCQTNLDGVYAIGDVFGKAMLAHVAQHTAMVVANHIGRLMNKPEAIDFPLSLDRVPSCIYTHPEIAMVGKTEQELKANNIPYKVAKFPFAAIGKAMADGDTTGFVKVLADPKYLTILGAHIIGNRATDMISEITTLIECEGTVTELAHSIHPHPTMSEAMGEVAEILEFGKGINI